MKRYDNAWDTIIPPYLRGLTFDGFSGVFVTMQSLEGKDVPIGEVSVTAGCCTEENIPSVLQQLKEDCAAFVAEHGRYPSRLTVDDSRVIGLGATLEEASAMDGCSRLPGERGSTDRNDVVRRKTALVTGGAQGFGEGMVRELVAAGAYTFIADMNIAGAGRLADELNRSSGREVACAVEVNVTNEDSVAAMLAFVARRVGGLDIMISNAGVLRAGSVKEMALEDFNFVTSVDYTGFFICTKFTARLMSYQNRAAESYFTDIIAISSKSGLEGSNKNGAYSGAKFGTIGLTQSFALELVSDSIKVNAVCPGNFLDGPLWSDPERGLFVQYLNAGKVPGAVTIADVRRFYESKVPLNRGCTVADVMKAIYYIVEQQYETGQAVPVTGGQVMLN